MFTACKLAMAELILSGCTTSDLTTCTSTPTMSLSGTASAPQGEAVLYLRLGF